MATFKEETQKKNQDKIREMLKDAPEYVQQYISFISSNAASSRLAYLRDILHFLQYIEEKHGDTSLECLDSLSADDINDWINHLSYYEKEQDGKSVILSNNDVSKRRKLSSVRGLYDYLFQQEKIEHNPAKRVPIPKVKRKNIVFMDKEEAGSFLETVQYGEKMSKQETVYHDKYGFRDFTILSLMLGTGIRVSEVVGLNIRDVDLKRHAIRVIRKGGKEDIVYFSDELSELLQDYIEIYRKKIPAMEGHETALFLSIQRKRISIRGVQLMVKKYTTHTELLKHITPHKLRSSYATALYNATSDLYLVASALGHESVETSRLYAHQSEQRKESVRNKVNWD